MHLSHCSYICFTAALEVCFSSLIIALEDSNLMLITLFIVSYAMTTWWLYALGQGFLSLGWRYWFVTHLLIACYQSIETIYVVFLFLPSYVWSLNLFASLDLNNFHFSSSTYQVLTVMNQLLTLMQSFPQFFSHLHSEYLSTT